MKHIFTAALLLASLQAQAINKCTSPDGSTVFQDAPCQGKGGAMVVRPAAGQAKPAATEKDRQAQPLSEAQRIEASIAASQKERRLRELTQRLVPQADAAVQTNLANCRTEQARLEREQFAYVQNLYGKTHAAQKAAELAAAATRCDTRDRDLRTSADTLRTECKVLGGCK
jgi:hypothetical protein